MPLTMIDAPPLAAVAQGVGELWAVQAKGFSADGKLLLVKATFSDSAFSATRSAFWIYDLTLGKYTVCVNDLIASGRSIDVSEVALSDFGGKTQLVAAYRDSGVASGLDPNRLALIRNMALIDTDLVAQVSGFQADASIDAVKASADGRFVAIETTATTLSSDLDTNGCKDIFVLDLTNNNVRRITTINGEEPLSDSLLGGLLLESDGGLSVAFQSSQAFTTNDSNAVEDVFVWRLATTQIDSTDGGSIRLVSATATGAVGGMNPMLNKAGVIFDSASGSFSTADQNAANDVWQATGNAIAPVSIGGASFLASQTVLADSSLDGRYVALVTASPEVAGAYGIDQLVVLDTVLRTYTTVSRSNSGALADDAVMSAVLSANGRQVAFSSQALNLGDGLPDGLMHLYLSSLAPPPTLPTTTAQLAALTAGQVAAMTTAQLAVLNGSLWTALSSTQVAALTSAQLVALSTARLNALTTAQFTALTTAQIAALSTVQVAALVSDDFAALRPTQVAAFTPQGVMALRTAQIARLGTAQAAALTDRQVAALSAAQLAALGSAQWRALNATQVAALATSQLPMLSTARLSALTTAQFTALKTSQIAAFSTRQVAALETADLAALRTAQLRAFSTAQVRALTTAEVRALSTAQIAGLATVQLAALSSAQLGALSTMQRSAAMSASNGLVTPLMLDLDGHGVQTLALAD